jgi:sortase A
VRASRYLGLALIASALVAGAVSFLPSSGSEVAPPAPSPGDPERLVISRLGIDAAIEPVTKDARGRMALPSKYENLAWYAPGPRPGEEGNAVIAGHLTRRDLSPAVFSRLKELAPGDEIQVVASGTVRTFRVKTLRSFPYDAEPPPEVFGPAPGPRLNLITCEGVWDQAKRSFTERLVVFAE